MYVRVTCVSQSMRRSNSSEQYLTRRNYSNMEFQFHLNVFRNVEVGQNQNQNHILQLCVVLLALENYQQYFDYVLEIEDE